MPDSVVQALFALFTSRECAEAIAGDLAEERARLGRGWFWLHVAGTAFALWRHAAADSPARVLGLAAIGGALSIVPLTGGLAAVRLFPESAGSPVSWAALSIVWWAGAAGVGATLVDLAPRRGMPACTVLATLGLAATIALAAATPAPDLWRSESLLFHVTGLIAAAPLLAGGAIAHWRHCA